MLIAEQFVINITEEEQKITQFHILLARNKIFPFSLLPATSHNQPTKDGLVLKYKSRPLEIQMQAWWKTIVSWPGLMSINTYNSFVVDIRQLFCNQLAILTMLSLTHQPDCHSTRKVTLENQVACTKYMKQSFKILQPTCTV